MGRAARPAAAGGISREFVDPRFRITRTDDDLRHGVWAGMFAAVMAGKETPLPLSVGLFGAWGSGKSHFMGLLRSEIDALSGQPGYVSGVVHEELARLQQEIDSERADAERYQKAAADARLRAEKHAAEIREAKEDQPLTARQLAAAALDTDDVRREVKQACHLLGIPDEEQAQVLTEQLTKATALMAQHERELNELMPGRQLYSFLVERAASRDYAGQLGLVSIIRKDLERLVKRLEDQDTPGPWLLPADPANQSPRRIDRIVLYIDDLDRCRPRQVVEVLQAVHLLLALNLFVVVVGVDPNWLIRSLRNQYPGVLARERPAGHADEDAGIAARAADYLEKIFNVPFTLPQFGADAMTDMANRLLPRLAGDVTGDGTDGTDGGTATQADGAPFVAPVSPGASRGSAPANCKPSPGR